MDSNNGAVIEAALTICQDTGTLPFVPANPLSANLHAALGSWKAGTPASVPFCTWHFQRPVSVGDGRKGGK